MKKGLLSFSLATSQLTYAKYHSESSSVLNEVNSDLRLYVFFLS